MPAIPQSLGSKVTTRDTSWLGLCMRAWGSEFTAPDRGVYAFSNGRQYDSTDRGRTGIYGVEVLDVLILDTQYPDMRDVLTLDDTGEEFALDE